MINNNRRSTGSTGIRIIPIRTAVICLLVFLNSITISLVRCSNDNSAEGTCAAGDGTCDSNAVMNTGTIDRKDAVTDTNDENEDDDDVVTDVSVRFGAHFINKSPYPVDLYFDDGNNGLFLSTLAAVGEGKNTKEYDTHNDHLFFVTKQGTMEPLYDGEEKIEFRPRKKKQLFVIPEHAAPSIHSNSSSSSSTGDTAEEESDEYGNKDKEIVTDLKLEFKASFINKSPYRVDLYFDDGNVGMKMSTLEPNGDKARYNTYLSNAFFVTRHGVNEALFENVDNPDKEERKIEFKPTKKDQVFVISQDAKPSTDLCQDRFGKCKALAQSGGCKRSPGWMIVHCCKTCDAELNSKVLIDPKIRCTKENLNITDPAWQPGDLNKLFNSWATDPEYQQYTPVVLSSPHQGANTAGNATMKEIRKLPPWVITFDTFLTDAESDALIRGGQVEGFERSTGQGKMSETTGEMEKIVITGRTSSNAWCMTECQKIREVNEISRKIELMTHIPETNFESFQILEYNNEQFYNRHHDTRARDVRPAGPRILTFFLYLADVEEGGETYFSELDIAVKPKKGRALVWPSVRDDDPEFWDDRMHHEAKPVIKGQKYAANHWIHLNDFMASNLWGCSGSFT